MRSKDHDLRILVAEDHAIVREGICSLLKDIHGVEVIGEAADGIEAIRMAAELKPDIILMDIAMPELNGLEATVRILKEFEDIRIIMLSMYATEEYVLQALRAGASGYLLKNARGAELEEAIRTVASGSTYLSSKIANYVAEYIKNPEGESPLERLTSRQREILQLIAEGYTTRNIAAKLHISMKTVETHRANLMKQIDVHDIPALVRFAIRTGLITPEA